MKKLLLLAVTISMLGCKSNEEPVCPCKVEIEKSWKLKTEHINGNDVLTPELITKRFYFYDFLDGDKTGKVLDTVQISEEDFKNIDFPTCNMDSIGKYKIH